MSSTKYVRDHGENRQRYRRIAGPGTNYIEDLPVSISKEEIEEIDDAATNATNMKEYLCSFCKIILQLVDREKGQYYCSHCQMLVYPKIEEDKDKTRIVEQVEIAADIEGEAEPAVSIIDNEIDAPSTKYGETLKEPKRQGGFKHLAEHGAHFTSYTEAGGDGTVAKSLNRPSKERKGYAE